MQIFLLFFMRPERFNIGRFSVRNYLGGYRWLNSHVFELYVISLGIVVLALCIAVFFFALGFMMTIVQVAVRLLCKNVMSITVLGQSPLDVCLSLPIFGVERVCGWEAMVVCADMTSMSVGYCMNWNKFNSKNLSSHSIFFLSFFFLKKFFLQVRYVMLGSLLLIWSHIVWVIVLSIALEMHRGHMLVLKRSESSAMNTE